MKRLFALVLTLAMVLSLAACGAKEEAPAEKPAETPAATPAEKPAETPATEAKTLRLAWTVAYQEDHPYTVAAETFKQYVEEKTEGRVNVELYAGGQLGGDVEMIEMLQMGTLDVAVSSSPTMANFTDVLIGCDMPYIWENDLGAMYNVLSGDVGQQLCDSVYEEIGVRALGFTYQPMRHFYTNKPIETLGDMKGLKIRCMQTPVHVAIFEALGSSPVSLAYNDIYSAMQQGTIDGFESDVIGGTASKFYEVADYLTMSGHFNNTVIMLMSDAAFSGLSEADQAICKEAAAKAGEASYNISVEANDMHIQNMLDNGMTMLEPDMTDFYNAVQSVIDNYIEIPEVKLLVDAAKAEVAK